MSRKVALIDEPADSLPLLRSVLESAGLEVGALGAGDGALLRLSALVSRADEPDAVLLGPGLSDPLDTARRVRATDSQVQIVFLLHEEQEEALKQELSSDEQIGGHWAIARPDQSGTVEVVRKAAAVSRQRRQLRTTLDRVKLRLSAAEATDASQLRQLVISERQLAHVLQQAQDAIVTMDESGVIRTWNLGAERLFGLEEAAAIGRHLSEVADEAWRVRTLELFEHLRGSDRAADEIGCRSQDRERRWISLSLTGVTDGHGRRIALCAIARDVTGQREVERALLASQERTRLVVESSLDAVVVIDQAGRVIDWNPQAESVFGHRREEALGRSVAELILPPRYRAAHARGLARFLDTGEGLVLNRRLELEALGRGGEEFPIELTIVPIRGEDRYEFAAFVRDITERRRLERAQQEQNEELERRVQERTSELEVARDAARAASRAKSALLANMSHEIRTPLNAVIGLTDLVRHGPLDAEQREHLDTVMESAEALLGMLTNLLELSRIESGAVSLERVPFRLRALVEEEVASLAVSAQARGLALDWSVSQEIPDDLSGDPRRLRQVLSNLLRNAVKFTLSGSVRVSVEPDSIERDQVSLRFSVCDTGIGLDPEDLARLLEPFEQADTSSTRAVGGSGLGLALCRQLVGLLGGTITVDSRPGEGSRFHFTARFAAGGTSDGG